MTTIKTFFATTFGILGAIILAPIVAIFGLLMLGLTFGLALIAAAAVTTAARQAGTASDDATTDADAEDAQPQPMAMA